MPIDTTPLPCIHCGTRTATHHAECPDPLLRAEDAYERRMNAYGQLRISAPDPNSFAQWSVSNVDRDAGVIEYSGTTPPEFIPPQPDPPEPPRDGSMFGLNRSTDETRLAGQRLGPPATVVDSARILRELYPDGRIAEQVYAASPIPSISAGFRAGRQTGRNSLVEVWEAELRGQREAMARMIEDELVYGPRGRSYPINPPVAVDASMRVDSLTPPHMIARAEAAILRKMHGR